MLKEWYIKARLSELATRTGVKLDSWQQVKEMAEVKQIILPSALTFYTGQPTVRQFFGVEDQTLSTKQKVLHVAGSLARSSNNPVLKAIVRAAEEAELTLREIDSDTIGQTGMVGKLDRTWFVLGDTATMEAENIELGVTIQTLAHQFELDGKYTLFLAQKQPRRLLGIFACEYELQGGVTESIQMLRNMGIELVLLTGAKTSIAKGLGTRLSLSLIHSELSSTDKERVLTSLIAQQPATFVLGSKWGGRRVRRIVLGKGEAGEGVAAVVRDLSHLATLVAEARTLVAASQNSPLWRNL
ncbi:MAG TPA: hypothetical protein VLA04_00190 [Verrucomicrobiae bacterium]|nr:hypothetical protein [Verrucomicrobiae bacterium]